ncbi:hypothetical protein N7468_000813 [Penicillium chermesinum]|uniref:Zn(2)-C6 fungal-type domain-containing protein n=1 Tax=Penicillium chermesinum TaxID=63820 RepID=A0A9W9TW61_9EURO|nr:uncharacterized protein N7468_000813 [Penicillium chermesinum]KAJ5245830.1 hypothetical protein N7468_000813 [Penicillium chermesinum]
MSACIICHKRKVRCDLATRNPCTNCSKIGVECRPYTRKRKRFTNSLSPSRDARVSESASQRSSQLPELPAVSVAPNDAAGEASNYAPMSVSNGEAFLKEESYRGGVSAADVQMLRDQGAYELPPLAIQKELMQSFNKYCAPWTPVVDPKWLEGNTPPSMLLLQSIFLAGSRVSKAHLSYGSSEVFYRRAKLLFFFGGGHGSLISIVAACLLHWYNPSGPENVSTDTSGFWIRTAGAMAFQIGLHKEPHPNARDRGLRRRLWWSLVIRDNVISAGVGRPRTINLRDSDVLPPSMDDFPTHDFRAQLFLAYCTISGLLGDTVECCLRQDFRQRRVDLENSVFRWAKQVIPKLRSSALAQEDVITSQLEVQQVSVMYFVVLTILHRSPTPNSPPPPASLIASSFIAGIYEEFLLRDELRYLGPVYAFYPLCAGLPLLSSWRYSQLQIHAEHELTVVKLCLQKLAERWPSAVGPLRALNKLTDKVREQGLFEEPLPKLDFDTASFFEGFDVGYCKEWALIGQEVESEVILRPTDTPRLTELQTSDNSLPEIDTSSEPIMDNDGIPALDTTMDPFGSDWEGAGFDWSGSWLLSL